MSCLVCELTIYETSSLQVGSPPVGISMSCPVPFTGQITFLSPNHQFIYLRTKALNL